MSYKIDFEPVGIRTTCEEGETILEAAQRAGIMLNATCGGEGVCGRCVVRVMDGKVATSNNEDEADRFGLQRDKGWHLACLTKVEGDVRVHIPPDSLTTAQRTQTEGQSLPITLDPAVRVIEVRVPPPSLDDLRSDADRIRETLGLPGLVFPHPVLASLSTDIRAYEYDFSMFLREMTVVAVRPPGSPALGLAVDLGTTKLAGYLIDLANGETLASAGEMNPQIAFGEDVMARIGHTLSKPDGGEQLQNVIAEALNSLAERLCAEAGYSTLDIADAVIVGNTAMHHLFLGLPVKQLGLAPYVAAESGSMDVNAGEIGLSFAPAANVHVLPNIAGFVGADHVAMLLGSGMTDGEETILGLDIGTNTEISLIAGGKHYSCSTASGPAFEGAHIRHGMRAAPGAIESVVIRDGEVMLQTIDHQDPVGICGSGILDTVAQLRKIEAITSSGSFSKTSEDPRIRQGEKGKEYVLVDGSENNGREITFNRSDVNQIQLAKGAMRTGVSILLEKAGISEEEIDTVILAGAFGTYLDVQSGVDIGMFPNLPKERFKQVGNAAGAGARMALLSKAKRLEAAEIARNVRYVELTTIPSFTKIFSKCLML